MLSARRLRANAGPPPSNVPSVLTYAQHQQAVADLARRYEAEIRELKAGGGNAAPVKSDATEKLEAELAATNERVEKLTAELEAARKAEQEGAEMRQLLESEVSDLQSKLAATESSIVSQSGKSRQGKSR